MRILKLGLISLIAFGLLITVFSLFFPSHIRISKAIDINNSRDSIFSALADLRKWKTWYPGADTLLINVSNGHYYLENKNTGQRISVKQVTDSTVLTETTGKNLKRADSGWNIISSGQPNTYTVQWYMDIYLKWYPWEKLQGLLMEKRYGPLMEKGLDNLKRSLEDSISSY